MQNIYVHKGKELEKLARDLRERPRGEFRQQINYTCFVQGYCACTNPSPPATPG